MTKRCEYLNCGGSSAHCAGGLPQCPKKRLKCVVGQSCWQVKTGKK